MGGWKKGKAQQRRMGGRDDSAGSARGGVGVYSKELGTVFDKQMSTSLAICGGRVKTAAADAHADTHTHANTAVQWIEGGRGA